MNAQGRSRGVSQASEEWRAGGGSPLQQGAGNRCSVCRVYPQAGMNFGQPAARAQSGFNPAYYSCPSAPVFANQPSQTGLNIHEVTIPPLTKLVSRAEQARVPTELLK